MKLEKKHYIGISIGIIIAVILIVYFWNDISKLWSSDETGGANPVGRYVVKGTGTTTTTGDNLRGLSSQQLIDRIIAKTPTTRLGSQKVNNLRSKLRGFSQSQLVTLLTKINNVSLERIACWNEYWSCLDAAQGWGGSDSCYGYYTDCEATY